MSVGTLPFSQESIELPLQHGDPRTRTAGGIRGGHRVIRTNFDIDSEEFRNTGR